MFSVLNGCPFITMVFSRRRKLSQWKGTQRYYLSRLGKIQAPESVFTSDYCQKVVRTFAKQRTRFQFFTAVTPSPKDTGFTLFASSTAVFKYLPSNLPLEFLKQQTWSVSTSSFENTNLRNLPLVVKHPTTGAPCLRYHEHWPESKTKFEATHISIDNQPPETRGAIVRELELLLHDRRVAYYHAWEKGDLLVNDNILTMHTRSDFTSGCERELWRIHFD